VFARTFDFVLHVQEAQLILIFEFRLANEFAEAIMLAQHVEGAQLNIRLANADFHFDGEMRIAPGFTARAFQHQAFVHFQLCQVLNLRKENELKSMIEAHILLLIEAVF
jgi:hypothetical protein